ncbi:MAG: 2-dehydro-3-deoxygalactonokinase [Comamonas sp.]
MNFSAAAPTVLIGLDWGTSSLRAFRFDAKGHVQEHRQSGHGITQLPVTGDAGFAQALALIAGDWLLTYSQAAVVACGMVGSAQGWREAAYVQIPATAAQLGQGGSQVSLEGVAGYVAGANPAMWAQRHLTILPGLIERGPAPILPNVMRGEETQIFGALHSEEAPHALTFLLPGTHSKWVQVRDGAVEHFDTFMTGEVFAALSKHTILGRTMQPSAQFDAAAFERGLQVAFSDHGVNGVLSTIFSTRTLGLEGQLLPQAQADYLSGLLIGHEVHAMRQRMEAATPCWLIGSEALCSRYVHALQAAGFAQLRTLPQATEQGIWRMAIASNLLPQA